MSARSDLADAIRPLLPQEWRIVPYERDIDPPNTTVVMLRQQRLRYDDTIGRLIAVYTVTIISPHLDSIEKAEDALDDRVNDVLDAFLRVSYARIPTAEKNRFGQAGYPAWNIDLEIPLTRKN